MGLEKLLLCYRPAFKALPSLRGWVRAGCVLLLAGCQPEAPGPSSVPAATNEAAPPVPASASEEARRVLFLGNSLSAGYGLDDPEQAFPGLIQQKIDSLGWAFRVRNAGLSGETTAGGLRRIEWLLADRVDVLIIELGGNDGLRGIDPKVTLENLQGIIDKTRARYPDVRILLTGMEALPNYGPDYTRQFREVFPVLARTNDVPLVPFLLEGVGGIPELNQEDGIHPTAAGHRIIAETVWQALRPLLEQMQTLP
jgi:acyl-CoA thioesterase-1